MQSTMMSASKRNLFIKLVLLSVIYLSASNSVIAQNKLSDSLQLIKLTQAVDDAVVTQDTLFLKNAYAVDFVFSHGSGRVEGRDGWLRSVAKGGFTYRQHDSITVELHKNIAIVKGLLHIKKQNKTKLDSYHLKYVKVYARGRGLWKMISHSTVKEWHDE